MTIETQKTTVEKSAESIFNSLSNIENFKKLMPSNLQKFEIVNAETFKFSLKGMPEIELKVKERIPNSTLILDSANEKLQFSLVANLTEVSENKTDVQLNFDGNFNAMMAMMIKGPITKFMEAISSNMDKL